MSRDDWNGLVTGRNSAPVRLRLRGVLGAAVNTASSPFLGLVNDDDQWWVKHPLPGLKKALVNEFVVGQVGALIGAPVCEVETVHISEQLLPHELRPGVSLAAGVGTATRLLPGTVNEIRLELNRRHDDDNRVRHAGVFALVDWCFGGDFQWLQLVEEDWELHSHDHGLYFPGGAEWTEETLSEHADTPVVVGDAGGLDVDELDRLADALTSVTREQLRDVLCRVPREMPVSDQELEALGWFLEVRAPSVAARLREIGESGQGVIAGD